MMEYTDALVFGMVNVTDKFVDIDGYSNARSLTDMFRQLAKAVEKYSKIEAQALIDASYSTDKEQYRCDLYAYGIPAQYIFEWEEVPTASNCLEDHVFGERRNGRKIKGYEVCDGMEYAPANYYVHIRIIL